MKKFRKWLPAIIMMLFIFGMSSLPGKTVHAIGLGTETVEINGHFIMYVLLGMAFYFATGNIIKSIIFALIYSLSDETHQLFVPNRSFELKDLEVDALGYMVGVAFLWKLQLLLQKKQKSLPVK